MRPASRSSMNVLRSAASISSRSRRNADAGLSPISSSLRPSRSHAALRRRLFQPRRTLAACSWTSAGPRCCCSASSSVEPVFGCARRPVLSRRQRDRVLVRVVAAHPESLDHPRQRQPVQQQRADHHHERQEHDVRAAWERRSRTASSSARRTPRPATPLRACPPTRPRTRRRPAVSGRAPVCRRTARAGHRRTRTSTRSAPAITVANTATDDQITDAAGMPRISPITPGSCRPISRNANDSRISCRAFQTARSCSRVA